MVIVKVEERVSLHATVMEYDGVGMDRVRVSCDVSVGPGRETLNVSEGLSGVADISSETVADSSCVRRADVSVPLLKV